MNLSHTNQQKISIGIVDDSHPYREALKYYFSQLEDIEIMFEANDGVQLIQQLEKKQPQVVLLDLDMPNIDGLKALSQLRNIYPSIKFIMLTMYTEKALISSFIAKGANSYLNKTANAEEIHTAIQRCCETDFYMNEWISEALVYNVKNKEGY